MKRIRIGNKMVGDAEPAFIVAEAGVNHNGDICLAKRLVDAAKDAGADAVKFQVFTAENTALEHAPKAMYQKKLTGSRESQYEMLKRLELTEEDYEELASYAIRKKMTFLSSPFGKRSADLLDRLDVPAFKIASGEITNFPFLEFIARKKRPIILSTGMATLGEIDDAVRMIRNQGVDDIVLLHCITSYPLTVEEANLRAIPTLKCAFKLPVGFSDHTLGITAPIAAIALGAVMIEKHFTLDRDLPGPDHKASSEPHELKRIVTAIRKVEMALGNGLKRPTAEEEEIKKVTRRSIVAKTNIPEGTIITEDMLMTKRPSTGIEPKYVKTIVGRKAKKNIKGNTIMDWGMIE
jgi:N-acetylneuraminate synthase/N,N'-diacetyllegionaminate synthase